MRRGTRGMTGIWRWRQGQSNSRDTSLLNPLELTVSGMRFHFVVEEEMATKRIMEEVMVTKRITKGAVEDKQGIDKA
jgi:hypothetical protein